MPRKKIGDFEDLKRRDTDSDGLSDYDEIFVYHSDPLSTESKHDGFTDLQRAKLDTSINNLFMKDFFIPNKNNNFKPHILKTRRIFFYSLSAVLIKILVVGFVFVFPVTAWLTPDFLQAESKEIVTLTNTLRQSLALQPLRENEVLEAAALAKAEDMVINQYFAHVSPEKKGLRYWLTSKGYNYQVAGENLAIGYSAPAEVIEAWKNSPTHYANLVDPDYNEIGVAMIAGQYQEFDTKLVAQMFGFQKTSPMQEVKPVEPPKTLVSTTTEPLVLSEKSVSVVVPPKDIKPLAKPQITTAIDNLLTKESSIDINILAPEAEQAVLFVNDKKQSTSKVVDGQVSVQLILEPGTNKVSVQAVLGKQTSISQEYLVEYDNQAPTIDEEKSFISAIKSTNNQAVVKIEAVLSADTKSAFVRYRDFDIVLKQDSQNTTLWTGNRIIENVDDKFFSPVVPATIVASDLAGNIKTQDLAWQKILLDNQSTLNQYLFIKSTDSNSLRPIFDISAWYYKFMILVAIIALLLNIFIEVRKQHLKTIASTVGFIGLLALLILF